MALVASLAWEGLRAGMGGHTGEDELQSEPASRCMASSMLGKTSRHMGHPACCSTRCLTGTASGVSSQPMPPAAVVLPSMSSGGDQQTRGSGEGCKRRMQVSQLTRASSWQEFCG